MSKLKLKITDSSELRKEIEDLYTKTDQILVAKWSVEIAKHILKVVQINYEELPEIIKGFNVNKEWQNNNARTHDVRQEGFKIHKLARLYEDNEVKKNALRVAGHAVASGHMKEHAIIASDYAIKVINLCYNNDFKKSTEERIWQLEKLKELISKNK